MVNDDRDWKPQRPFLRDPMPMPLRREFDLRRAWILRLRVELEQRREGRPGGLFGTYWKHGIEGRNEARMEAGRRWDSMLSEADRLEARHA